MTLALAWLVCLLAGVPVAALALECAAGARAGRVRRDAGEAPPFIVLMPAHDEAAVIARAVSAVLAQLRADDRLMVIADNCTDGTAAIARGLGATVLERRDPERRGKGHALEHAREHLGPQHDDRGDEAGEVVIVVDADCSPEPGALVRLAATSARRAAVVQGTYLLVPGERAPALVRVSCFAFLVKNLVRQRGLQRLAGAALLQGSGMAFPRPLFARLRWRASSLVEDLETGLDLLLAGERVVFEETARFVSPASSRGGTVSQRRRWEHGMLQTMASAVPRLVAAGVRGRVRLLAVALDLVIPPTALLVLASAAVVALTVAALGFVAPAIMLVAALFALAAAVAAAWLGDGRAILPVAGWSDVPRYLAWKLPILAQFVTTRERRWIRTEREP
jgi:cellulose synthase/poly-beta-1,6-N-acetylglucosamine synthase-like glycosyltransferase